MLISNAHPTSSISCISRSIYTRNFSYISSKRAKTHYFFPKPNIFFTLNDFFAEKI